MMELNPREAERNNVPGTRCVAAAANRLGVKQFVVISTGKAARPRSNTAVSRRLADLVVQDLD
jgi:FlaA1/EpsC-like NDP-sugar epimerase